MSGKKCRGLKGFAAGGIVDVPGASRSSVADDIHVDDAPVGGFVLPADSVQALRRSNPELLAQILAVIQQAGGDADGAATAQIAISNGELFIPPEAVAALGGAEVLNAIKDATHQQVNAPSAKPIDAPPPPGGVNAPLDAVVQPPRGLPPGMAAGVLPDAALPGSGQAQQQRTFFKGGGAVARGLFTGGGVVRRAFPNGGALNATNTEERLRVMARNENSTGGHTPTEKLLGEITQRGSGVLPLTTQRKIDALPAANRALIARHQANQYINKDDVTPADMAEYRARDAAGREEFGEDWDKARAPLLHQDFTQRGYVPWEYAGVTATGTSIIPDRATPIPDRATPTQGASVIPAAQAATTQQAAPTAQQKPAANTDAQQNSEPQHGAWQTGAGGSDNIAWRRRADGTLEATNVFTRDDKGNITSATSAHDPYKIPDNAAGGAPAGLSAGAQVAGGGAAYAPQGYGGVDRGGVNPSLVNSSTYSDLMRARVAAGLSPDGGEPRGMPGVSISLPSAPLRTPQQERMYNDALAALHERATTPLRKLNGAKAITARQQAEKVAAAETLAGMFQQDANRQYGAQAMNAQMRAAELAARQQEAQQPRGFQPAQPGQPSGEERMKSTLAMLMEQAVAGDGAAAAKYLQLTGKMPFGGQQQGKKEWVKDTNSEGLSMDVVRVTPENLAVGTQRIGNKYYLPNGEEIKPLA